MNQKRWKRKRGLSWRDMIWTITTFGSSGPTSSKVSSESAWFHFSSIGCLAHFQRIGFPSKICSSCTWFWFLVTSGINCLFLISTPFGALLPHGLSMRSFTWKEVLRSTSWLIWWHYFCKLSWYLVFCQGLSQCQSYSYSLRSTLITRHSAWIVCFTENKGSWLRDAIFQMCWSSLHGCSWT